SGTVRGGNADVHRTDAPLLHARRGVGPEDVAVFLREYSAVCGWCVGTTTGDRGARAALRVHGELRCRRPWAGLCKRVRVGFEIDGDVLRSCRTFLVSRLSAWATRDGRAPLSGYSLCAAGCDAARSKKF